MKLFYSACLVCLCFCCGAQVNYVDEKAFGEADGFTGGEISSMIQDRKGFIWISTRDGLYRFNGTSFKHYRHNASDSNSLPSNIVTFCYQDKDGDYWVGVSNKGLYRFDDRTEKFSAWKNNNTLEIDASNLTNPIAPFEDSQGRFWISATTQGIVLINKKEKTARLFNVCDQTNPVDLYRSCRWVHKFAEDSDGWFWLCSNNGLIHFNPANGSFIVNHNARELTNYFKDGQGRYWLGTWAGGLKNFDPATGQWKKYLWANETAGTTNIVNSIAEKDEDHLWISSIDGGLMVFEKSTGRFIKCWSQRTNENFLNSTGAMFRDSTGNIWVTTEHKLVRVNGKNILQFGNIGNPALGRTKTITSFLHLPGDSLLFIGALYTKEGLHVYNLKTRAISVISFRNDNRIEDVKDIFADSKKQVWVCTGTGIYLLDRQTLKAKPFPAPSKKYSGYFNNSFEKTAEDNQHRLWFASRWSGLFCYDPSRKSIIHYSSDSSGIHHIPFNHIEYVIVDQEQNIWLGTHAYVKEQPPAFCITANGEIRSYDKKIPFDAVFQLAETRSGALLVGTAQSGLYKITNPLKQNETIQYFSEDQGMTNGFIEGFAEDKKQNLWIATHNGLSCLTSKGFINYHTNDGLANNYIGGRPYYDDDGNIFLPFEDGFQYFNADSLLGQHQPIGPVILESLSINQQSYHEDPNQLKQLDLSYDRNNLSFAFAAFDLSQGDKLQYGYKLEGSDTVWNSLGNNRRLFFSTLAPGHYKLRLRAGDRFGNWSDKEFVLPIRIHPPFWNEWWFYLLCVIILFAAGYFIYKARINRMMAEQRLRNKIARDLHDDIGSTLSGIKLFSNMAQTKLVQEKSEAIDIVERIGERSEKMIEAMSDIVWSINPVNDELENMLIKMKQYAAEMFEPKNISYQFLADEKVLKMKIGIEVRKDIYLIFKEGINNAVKHSRCRNVTVKLRNEHRLFEMIITDDGIGFASENGNGNGLGNFKQRAKNIGGRIDIASKQGEGTTIALKVPLT